MDQTLNLFQEIQSTPEPRLRRRLEKLPKPLLVDLLAIMRREARREARELRDELEALTLELLRRESRHTRELKNE